MNLLHNLGRRRIHGVRVILASAASVACLAAVSLPLLAQVGAGAGAEAGAVDRDTVRAGRFDMGKMWTFEYAPAEYFSETYGFDATDEWFERARMSPLRIPGCSASFVSPNGLVATNHHCVRGPISRVSRPGEGLLDNGFYAATLGDERSIDDYYADQIMAIHDISAEVFAATDQVREGEERNRVRQEILERIAGGLKQRYSDRGDSIWVQTIGLYNGGRYSAYVFRRFTDVRLVAAVEAQAAFFGGDPDNFTYPRYALDFAFLRIYQDGRPYETPHYFGWGEDGVEEGDVVFVIGNPGSTNRLTTMSQLEYQREVQRPNSIAWLSSRLAALYDYWDAEPEESEEWVVRNRIFSLSNSLKSNSGRYDALNDAFVMAKRRDIERQLRDAIRENDGLRERYSNLFERMAAIQQEKGALATPDAAFRVMTSSVYTSATIRRAVAAVDYVNAIDGGASAESLATLQQRFLEVSDLPAGAELRFLAARFGEFARFYGPAHEVTRAALGGGSPMGEAAALMSASALDESLTADRIIENVHRLREDPAVRLAAVFMPYYREYRREIDRLNAAERELAADLGRVRFEVYGRSQPPDGTFSLRITDGVVRGYEYNGTLAPPYTTFFGLYDRYYAHRGAADWALPDRWTTPPAGLDLRTPLNFVSTADTYGGNSGSPAVTQDLELVGLNFDRNIEGLSRAYVYLPERGRNVMVDIRAVHAVMDQVYDADRIVQELLTGRLFETEAEADRVNEGG